MCSVFTLSHFLFCLRVSPSGAYSLYAFEIQYHDFEWPQIDFIYISHTILITYQYTL